MQLPLGELPDKALIEKDGDLDQAQPALETPLAFLPG